MVTLDILQSMSSHNLLQNIQAQLFLRQEKDKPKARQAIQNSHFKCFPGA